MAPNKMLILWELCHTFTQVSDLRVVVPVTKPRYPKVQQKTQNIAWQQRWFEWMVIKCWIYWEGKNYPRALAVGRDHQGLSGEICKECKRICIWLYRVITFQIDHSEGCSGFWAAGKRQQRDWNCTELNLITPNESEKKTDYLRAFWTGQLTEQKTTSMLNAILNTPAEQSRADRTQRADCLHKTTCRCDASCVQSLQNVIPNRW